MRHSLPLLAALLTTAVAPGAQALEAWPPLPSLALNPQAPAPGWSGFYMGSEMSVLSGKHVRNGVGAAAYGGYRARLDNNVIVAIEAGAGRTPLLTRQGWQSANFGFARARVGYEMGRLTPYVTAAGMLAPTAPDAVNALFSGEGRLRSAASVGAGFDYRINNNLSVGLSVNAVQGGFGGLR
jgi:opacity protein-like surface antigen